LQKILIIQTASIGDVILATPVLEALHSRFPEAGIDFLLKKGIENVFRGHPFLHEVIIWDKSKKKYRNLYSVFRKIRKNKYTLIVNIQRFAASGFLTAFSRSRVSVGFDKNPFSEFFSIKVKHNILEGGNTLHETERNLLLVESFTGKTQFSIRLYPTPQDVENVKTYRQTPYICIAPASLWFTKQFPAGKWIQFVRSLNNTYMIYLLGSKSDYTLCESIITDNPDSKIVNLAGKLSFLQSAALMQNAVMNYVNDSAPLHLASAVNANVAAIFCSTIPGFGFGPLSQNSVVIETQQKLPCRPCGLHGKKQCPEGHFNCAETIEIEQLLQQLPCTPKK